MTTPLSRLAFEDCYDIFDKAIESPRGVQRMFVDRGQAWSFRVKLNRARTYDRINNSRVFDKDHPLYNQTIYAQITVRQPYWDEDRERWVLRLEKGVIGEMEIEEIPVEEEAAE